MRRSQKAFMQRYTEALADAEVLADASYRLSEDLNPVSSVEDVLILAYACGYRAINELFGASEALDIDRMRELLDMQYDGIGFRQRVQEYVDDADSASLERVVLTEFHRMFNAGANDCAMQVSQETGRAMKKTWVTMKDDKVRDTHIYLQSMTVNADEDFYTYDGDHAPYPGGFMSAENNVRCRCTVMYSFA